MADDIVSLSGEGLKFGRSPATGEQLVGNAFNSFTYTTFPVTWGNPTEFQYPIKVNGQIWSTATGFKFPDGTTQSSAATTYSPPTYLNNRIVSNVSGATAAPSGNTLTQVLDSTAGSAQGSILYRNASTWTPLAPGTAGQVLTTQGASADPTWTSQGWIRLVKTTTQTIAGAAYVDDTQLQFSVVANKVYAFRFALFVQAPSLGAVSLAVNGPASPSLLRVGPQGTALAVSAYDTVIVNGNSPSNNLSMGVIGTLATGSNGGAFAVRWQVTSSTNAVVMNGSWLEWALVG
jgi:hypothetical protein